jgi:hypothetical protein
MPEQREWTCPRDGTVLVQMGRRPGGSRCPTCKGVFIDVEGLRLARAGGPPVAMRVLMNVVTSAVALMVVRRFLSSRKSRRP